MKYIEQALKMLGDYASEDSSQVGAIEAQETLTQANKELEALKASGVEVKIEQIERVTVVRPKARRRPAKKEKV